MDSILVRGTKVDALCYSWEKKTERERELEDSEGIQGVEFRIYRQADPAQFHGGRLLWWGQEALGESPFTGTGSHGYSRRDPLGSRPSSSAF